MLLKLKSGLERCRYLDTLYNQIDAQFSSFLIIVQFLEFDFIFKELVVYRFPGKFMFFRPTSTNNYRGICYI